MQIDRGADVDVADAVAVGQAELLVVAEKRKDALDAAADHRLLARVDERHPPGLGGGVMHLHLVGSHVEGHVRHVQEVILKILLDDVALVAEADDEFIDAVMGIDLHDVPDDRHAADLDHRLRLDVGFLGKPRSKAAGEENCFHRLPPHRNRPVLAGAGPLSLAMGLRSRRNRALARIIAARALSRAVCDRGHGASASRRLSSVWPAC